MPYTIDFLVRHVARAMRYHEPAPAARLGKALYQATGRRWERVHGDNHVLTLELRDGGEVVFHADDERVELHNVSERELELALAHWQPAFAVYGHVAKIGQYTTEPVLLWVGPDEDMAEGLAERERNSGTFLAVDVMAG